MNDYQRGLKFDWIKNEIMNYKFYQSQIDRIDKELEELDDALNDKRFPGSIIRMYNHSVKIGDPNWITTLVSDEQKLEEEKEDWQSKIDRIEKWLTVLLPTNQKIVRLYVIENKCTDVDVVADASGYSKEGILKVVTKAINKISNIF